LSRLFQMPILFYVVGHWSLVVGKTLKSGFTERSRSSPYKR
jgi:hypothetical protein